MGNPRPLLRLFSSFQTNITDLTTNIREKMFDHPVFGAGIRTHNPRNMSLLPSPLDQGSRPNTLHNLKLTFFVW